MLIPLGDLIQLMSIVFIIDNEVRDLDFLKVLLLLGLKFDDSVLSLLRYLLEPAEIHEVGSDLFFGQGCHHVCHEVGELEVDHYGHEVVDFLSNGDP